MTFETTKTTMTKAQALKTIRNAPKGSSFMVSLSAFLPTTEDRGFEGSACMMVSRKAMLKAIDELLRDGLVDRGAKIEMRDMVYTGYSGTDHTYCI